ncbi:Sodium/nucleoside cotransporter 2, partial [Dryobates pubescens]
MEANQITLESFEKGTENPAFSCTGEERLSEEHHGPCGERREEGQGQLSCCRRVLQPATRAKRFCKAHAKMLKRIMLGLLGVGYLCYFIAACWLNFQRALPLVIMTAVVAFFTCWSLFKKFCGAKVLLLLRPAWKCLQKGWPWLRWFLWAALLGGLIAWLVLDTSKNPEQLISLAGFCFLVLFLFAFSKHHGAVSWRAVLWGLGLEFLFGIFVLRTTPGIQAFRWLGDQIQYFLGYTTAGSGFVFGNELIAEVFAFQTLPIIVFFSCVMSILYYLGVMQWIIVKVGVSQLPWGVLEWRRSWWLCDCCDQLRDVPERGRVLIWVICSPSLSSSAVLAQRCLSPGCVLQIDAASLIAASVMAAPCALAMSKLIYPEVEESKFKGKESVQISRGEEQNVLEAASNGAATSVGLVANIAANLIAFLAVLEFINAALRWLGEMVDIEGLSFQVICSYVLMPVAFLMGADWADSPVVAELLGIKIFLNEFVAYQHLAEYKKNRLAGAAGGGGRKQWISERAESITTFALCGFANLSSIGIMLGGLGSMVPQRRGVIASLVLRALLTGICVSMLNACLAGLLHVPTEVGDCVTFFSTANTSSPSYTLYTCCQELFASSVLENGNLSFTGPWAGVAQAVLHLAQCCGPYNHSSC